MSPEYAGYGLCSLKSDVYSFGVLVLEIVSGQRSGDFHHTNHHHDLLGHAWILYKEGRPLELVGPNIVNSIHLYELERSIHVALLCVQQHPEDKFIF
ncbi:cysteine-rich receptor-like protein kinase 10 [Phtheirospermum japonicum]|uniref:Cysteine-rich receptor-like protein kinase 10 n=1 Tax=Phtheirospermum japonicum TaxID=374723 RepID=A0A830BHE9_9LAMI|nr:cysteine-rich receptor-like protein kinase 10 [Phtheirospermum japonicum]